jgi:hypothetical protein
VFLQQLEVFLDFELEIFVDVKPFLLLLLLSPLRMKYNLFLKTQVIPHSRHSLLVVKANQLMLYRVESLFVLRYVQNT